MTPEPSPPEVFAGQPALAGAGGSLRPTRFTLGLALVSLLLTLVMAMTIWEGYFPDLDREGLRRRKAYYEKVLRPADLSWKEGLYYKIMDGEPKKP